jgi:two-component system CheB/CheR fusion protein
MKGPVARINSASRAPSPVRQAELFPIVGIGASAGGLEAFTDLLRGLPEKTGMAFVLVQHLDPSHSSDLREILARITKIPVQQVTDGVAVRPDNIYVIPPNTSMALENGVLRLAARVLTRGQHMPIDHFLRSLAEDRGNRAISVILSGTASDGTEGSRAIKAAGGITFAQDEKSAKYSSMPHSAVTAGCVDFILPPPGISRELARVAQHPYLAPTALEKSDLAIVTSGHMEALLSLLREAIGVDFTHYKQTTLRRRIERRMVLHKLEKLKDYVRYVRNTTGEIEELYQDILIHVTGFFRDPEAFEALRKHVLPTLFRDNTKGTARIWVPGCSTGEEAYSLAMAMLEYLWLETTKTAKPGLGTTPFQIFATDISDGSLDRARAGLYSEASVAGVSPERLRRFFMRIDGGYQIVKPVREMCIFAKQNVAKDPPFSNLDLISCRNLLIYLGPLLQKRVVPTLHYALKPGGFLLLGGAESLGTFSEYFAPLDKKNRIYQKTNSSTRLPAHFGSPDSAIRRRAGAKAIHQAQPVSTVEKEVDRLLLNRFVPASIVVNEQMEIVHFRGKTGHYLEPATGQPTFSLSKMAREGLLVDLRAALTKAKKRNVAVRKAGVRVRSNGHTREVTLEVSPLRRQSTGERCYVIVFQETPAPTKGGQGKNKASKARTRGSRDSTHLKRELAETREQFQTLIEEHETVSEEFKSANEEVLSANEELQSTNEELETAKEELQSSNEELTTLNEELQSRNSELTAVNNDLLNVLGNVTIPVVIVGQDLHIRRFTTPAQKLLNLLPSDVGRRLSDIRPNLDVEDLGQIAGESIENVTTLEREVRETGTGAWHLLRVRPYKTWDSKIDGAVISFQDIDIMKRSLDQMHDHADALIETAREAILILDHKLQVISANLTFYRNFEVAREETQNRPIYDLGNGQWNIPRLRELLENILPNNGQVQDFEVTHDFPHLGSRRMMLNARRIEPQPGQKLILLYIEDVTIK